ncbi:MAG: ABC transporter permease [Chloroflexi bacterium]|nr:ABC transporter permease [Chloroflexota bacterium]MCY3581130.1 ABC transporter permease [Chloroflexota bacterium]MCY3715593.1 ABC transporter permease [Chloroflexota bacterium]MDE2650669.1 ABC transporter permease [Chloroflexota bacterium]MXV93633.1 ABC transporter permease [Chloroflexota bacterium]
MNALGGILNAGTGGRVQFLRRNGPVIMVYAFILLLVFIGATQSERFLSERNLANVARQSAFLGIVALGQMLVILTAGIDLSVGSLVKVSILVSAIVMNGESANVLPAILATLALGVLVGMIHGFLINELRIAPFIVTLASLVILKGIGLTISSSPVGKASREVMMFYVQKVGPLPVIALMFFMLVILTMLLLRYTVFGKHLVAVGGNIEVAHLSGVPVKRTRYAVYVLCSLTAAVTGLLWLSRMGVGDPAIGDGIELQTITAVIIGGTSLFGGRASVLGTLGGVLLLGISANLLVMLGVSQFIQGLIQGIIIVAAVALYKQEGD